MALYQYQEDYLSGLPKNCVMAAEVGTGKGQMALEHFKRHAKTHLLVVVAPASKVREGGWVREFHLAGLPEFPVISYERFTKDYAEYAGPSQTIIFDEAHYLCNATSKRAKTAIAAASKAHQWIMLTATPLPNGWRSAATYAILSGLVRNKTAFLNRFVITDRSRGFPIIMGYREEPTLESWWSGISRPLKRTGALKLPSRMIGTEPEMTAAEMRAYKRAVRDRIGPDKTLLDNPSKLFSTLRQIPTVTRAAALESLLDSTDEHVVVFYNFDSEREAVRAMLDAVYPSRRVYEQSGHASDLPPREEWDTLPPSVTLVQYQSGAQAIELTYASITVYLSPPTSYANYEQSKGRTRRNGQGRTTLFYHIAVKGSLDRHIWKIISTKRDFSVKMIEKVLDYKQ